MDLISLDSFGHCLQPKGSSQLNDDMHDLLTCFIVPDSLDEGPIYLQFVDGKRMKIGKR